MPWKASSVLDEKLRFVFEYERDEETMGDLCARFGICRDTGYVWLRRYRQYGVSGLVELNRSAHHHPNQTSAEIETAVLELREAHMRWGPRKLRRILERDQPGRPWPATSTIGEIVKRAGLVIARKKRRRTEPYTAPLAHANESNRVWCADFKGWFKAGDGARVDPLTITDAWSRYLLHCQAVEKTDTDRVRAIFEAAFREYGLPAAIRTDNGAPFAFCAVGGLSRLSVSWIKLGIVPERIEAGHPEQNGRHERMHRSLKQEVRRAEDWRAQQRELDRFREDFNFTTFDTLGVGRVVRALPGIAAPLEGRAGLGAFADRRGIDIWNQHNFPGIVRYGLLFALVCVREEKRSANRSGAARRAKVGSFRSCGCSEEVLFKLVELETNGLK